MFIYDKNSANNLGRDWHERMESRTHDEGRENARAEKKGGEGGREKEGERERGEERRMEKKQHKNENEKKRWTYCFIENGGRCEFSSA